MMADMALTESFAFPVLQTADRKPKEATLAHISGWILILILAVLALFGIYICAHAADIGFGLFGAALSGFAILMLFRMIVLMLPHQADER